MNFGNILKGWGKWAGLMATTPQEEQQSIARMAICAECVFAKESKFLELISGNAQQIDGLYCEQCGCPCHQKSLVAEENCPEGKWEVAAT